MKRVRRWLARMAYRFLRPEIDALTHPWVRLQREQLENHRKILILTQEQGPALERALALWVNGEIGAGVSFKGLGGIARS